MKILESKFVQGFIKWQMTDSFRDGMRETAET